MLRVLGCYAGGGLRQETHRSLVKNVPIGCLEMVNVSGDISTYWLEFRKRWTGKHDLVTVEQDNVLTPEMLPSFNMCDEPWCVYEYEGPVNMVSRGASDRYLKTSLGCTRFSQRLQQEVPWTEFSKKDYFSWYLIDYRIAVVLGKKGYSPHIHGEVEHLHDYASDPGRLIKEDELYNEAIDKTKRDPKSILGHPGMELEDAGVAEDGSTFDNIITYTRTSEAKKAAAEKKPATGKE